MANIFDVLDVAELEAKILKRTIFSCIYIYKIYVKSQIKGLHITRSVYASFPRSVHEFFSRSSWFQNVFLTSLSFILKLFPILTTYLLWSTCFRFLYQVKTGGGFEPVAWQTSWYSRPTRTEVGFWIISTFSGRTVKNLIEFKMENYGMENSNLN